MFLPIVGVKACAGCVGRSATALVFCGLWVALECCVVAYAALLKRRLLFN
jgi:hypothetical protein